MGFRICYCGCVWGLGFVIVLQLFFLRWGERVGERTEEAEDSTTRHRPKSASTYNIEFSRSPMEMKLNTNRQINQTHAS